MNGNTHRDVAAYSLGLFAEACGDEELSLDSRTLMKALDMIADATQATDNLEDLEFIDVEAGRDDPHAGKDWIPGQDTAHRSQPWPRSGSLTAMSHFIDIRKGRGEFDDYDGYSYRWGSGSVGEHQTAGEVGEVPELLRGHAGMGVDELVNWWFNDEYVHAPGQIWYRSCSPALENYSFFHELGRFASIDREMSARFPLADCVGAEGKGIPYSIFTPVDNLARYWYEYVHLNAALAGLGPVLHAIADAATPQHAAGCLGNYHDKYENDLESWWPRWRDDPSFRAESLSLVRSWHRLDDKPPANDLQLSDRVERKPAGNWRIDQLVTWLALNAYHEFTDTYGGFAGGYTFNLASGRRLVELAVAMSAHVLWKLARTWQNNTSAPVPLAAPQLVAPDDGVIYVEADRTTMLSARPTAGAAFYEFEIATVDGANLLDDRFVAPSAFLATSFQRPARASVKWRVTAAPADGPCIHTPWRTIVDKERLPAPTLLSPAPGSMFTTSHDCPTIDIFLSWRAVPRASSYRVVVREFINVGALVAEPGDHAGEPVAISLDDILEGKEPGGAAVDSTHGFPWKSGYGPADHPTKGASLSNSGLQPLGWVWTLHTQQESRAPELTLAREWGDVGGAIRQLDWSVIALDESGEFAESLPSDRRGFEVGFTKPALLQAPDLSSSGNDDRVFMERKLHRRLAPSRQLAATEPDAMLKPLADE
jgi:hypothetical protein